MSAVTVKMDIKEIIIVNESSDENVSGDLMIFENINSASLYVEPIDIINKEYFIYGADGSKFDAKVVDNIVILSKIKNVNNNKYLIRKLLIQALECSHRMGRASDVDASSSTESIIRAIGFTH